MQPLKLRDMDKGLESFAYAVTSQLNLQFPSPQERHGNALGWPNRETGQNPKIGIHTVARPIIYNRPKKVPKSWASIIYPLTPSLEELAQFELGLT